MSAEKFVYVTYIAATPTQVFKALIDGELTRQYWKHTNESSWKPGSKWKHVADDGNGTVKLVGQVIKVIPNRRLVLTWGDLSDENNPEAHSRVAIDIEPVGDMVRLTVTHDELRDPDMLKKISNGWPRVLSSLKSFLETGKALDTWA
jgi:uncharacterized protein YndB with AHSA1/START domain